MFHRRQVLKHGTTTDIFRARGTQVNTTALCARIHPIQLKTESHEANVTFQGQMKVEPYNLYLKRTTLTI